MTSGARHRTRACRHRDANRRLQETMGYCFEPVINNEKTYHNVCRRRRPAEVRTLAGFLLAKARQRCTLGALPSPLWGGDGVGVVV